VVEEQPEQEQEVATTTEVIIPEETTTVEPTTEAVIVTTEHPQEVEIITEPQEEVELKAVEHSAEEEPKEEKQVESAVLLDDGYHYRTPSVVFSAPSPSTCSWCYGYNGPRHLTLAPYTGDIESPHRRSPTQNSFIIVG